MLYNLFHRGGVIRQLITKPISTFHLQSEMRTVPLWQELSSHICEWICNCRNDSKWNAAKLGGLYFWIGALCRDWNIKMNIHLSQNRRCIYIDTKLQTLPISEARMPV